MISSNSLFRPELAAPEKTRWAAHWLTDWLHRHLVKESIFKRSICCGKWWLFLASYGSRNRSVGLSAPTILKPWGLNPKHTINGFSNYIIKIDALFLFLDDEMNEIIKRPEWPYIFIKSQADRWGTVRPDWVIFKVTWHQIFFKSSPNNCFGLFWNCCGYFLKNLAFLFQHLVTLMRHKTFSFQIKTT